MITKRNYALYLHCLHNYWFCFKNWLKNHLQVYLEECKYRAKKNTNVQIHKHWIKSNSDSEPDSEAESKSDAELMAKLKSDSD